MEQDGPDLEGGGVETDGREQQADGGGGEADRAGRIGDAQDAGVGQAGGLGLAGRAGSIDDVGQVLGRDSGVQIAVVVVAEGAALFDEDGGQRLGEIQLVEGLAEREQ